MGDACVVTAAGAHGGGPGSGVGTDRAVVDIPADLISNVGWCRVLVVRATTGAVAIERGPSGQEALALVRSPRTHGVQVLRGRNLCPRT
jgi:hypothetical protein